MNDLEKKLMDYADSHADLLFSYLTKLVSFDSQNFITSGREMECQQYIKGRFEALGLETELYSPDSIEGIKQHEGYLAGRGLENRPNVSGVLRGSEGKRSVMLAAHTDTMPTGNLENWTVDPFGGEVKDGRLYGLGSGDNKFGTASGYFALEALKKCGITLRDNVVLTAYCDEEYGGGDGALAACLKYPCDSYINFDGGNYEIWPCSLGGGGFDIEIMLDGTTTDTVEPICEALYQIKELLKPFGQARREELHKNPLYTGSDMERSAYRLMGFSCGEFGSNLDRGTLEFVIYTASDKATIMAELAQIEAKVRELLAARGMKTSGFRPTTRFFGYHEGLRDESFAAIKKAAEDAAGHEVKVCGSCLSDLSVFLPWGGASSLNFGILRDFSLYGGAHQPDEYVECDQFLAHAKAVMLYLVRYCGGSIK